MALSEGLKGFVDFFVKGFSDTEDRPFTDLIDNRDDDRYETDGTAALEKLYGNYETKPRATRSFDRESNVIDHPNAYKTGEVVVIEPRSFSESAQIVKKLLEEKTVVLHLDLLDKEQSQRTIDFVCGAAHALHGTPQKISDMVVLFTPSNVALSVDNGTTQSKFSEALWNKPL